MNAIQTYITARLDDDAPAGRADNIARLYRLNRIVRRMGAREAMKRALEYVWHGTARPSLYWGPRGQWGGPFVRGGDTLRYVDKVEHAGLRFVDWSDKLARLNHTGWFTDDNGDTGSLRGGVWQLPGRKGFARLVYGYCEMDSDGTEMNPGSAVLCVSELVEFRADNDCARDRDEMRQAARFADRLAEITAEQERDYRRTYDRGRDAAESDNLLAEQRAYLLPLLAEFRAVRRGRVMLSERLCELLQSEIRTGLADYIREREKRDSLWTDCPICDESAWLAGFMDHYSGQGFVRAVRLGWMKASDWQGAPDANPCFAKEESAA